MDEDKSTAQQSVPQPAGIGSPGPGEGDVFATLDVTPTAVVRAITVAVMAYVAAWIAAFGGVLLGLLAVSGDSDVNWWWLLTAPGQLVAMAFRSPASATFAGDDPDFRVSATLSVTVIPLVVLAVALCAVRLLTRREETNSSSRRGAVTLAAVTGLTFAIIAWLLALVLRVSADDGGDEISFHAGKVQVLLLATLIAGITSLIAQRPLRTWGISASTPAQLQVAARAVLVHFTVFATLSIPFAVGWALVEGEPRSLLALPITFLNGTCFALTLGHLGALTTSGVGEFLGESGSAHDSIWLFGSDVPIGFLLLIVIALVSVLASAIAIHLRSRDVPRIQADWVWMPLAFALGGGVLTILSRASVGAGADFGSGAAMSFGPAAWFFLVMAVWGAVTEAVARIVAPSLVGAVPERARKLLVGPPLLASESSPGSGAALGSAGPTVSVPSQSLSRRAKLSLAGIGGLVMLGIVAAIAISIVNKTVYGPEKQVDAYFDALASGHAGKAVDLARLKYSDGQRVLLTDSILTGSKKAITHVKIGNVNVDGDSATVTATYTIDGSEQSQDITLTKDGSHFGVFDRWKLADPELGSIFLDVPGATSLVVNGHKVPVSSSDGSITLPAFPGEYEISPRSDSSLVTYGSQTVSIGTDEESLDFEAAPTDALTAKVSSEALEFLNACIAKKEADPDGCPNTTYESDLKNVKWTLDREPVISVESDYDGGWAFSTTKEGKASVSGTSEPFFDGDTDTHFTDETTIDLSGSVRISGETVTIEVDDSYF